MEEAKSNYVAMYMQFRDGAGGAMLFDDNDDIVYSDEDEYEEIANNEEDDDSSVLEKEGGEGYGMGLKPSTMSMSPPLHGELVQDMNMLHHAASTNNQIALKKALNDIVSPNESIDSNRTDETVKQSADPNEKDENGQTALHFAADGGFVECVSILLQTDNINVNALDNDGTSVLQAAVISGKSVKVCEMLLEAGADPDSKDVDGDTPREAASEDPEMRTLFVKF
eukprot:CAMPEP_0194356938 /NCGR_PEP_ID=MMETSP0174-20130528/4496_1 /TAXON_ID=216777 /ORGANISM="Proboscia alata, Strain PI-D3" /LENGTH=224 /DNA_ID=CAMNT_0039126749 /DNA_START=346 /DNA_END=1020 /DNA_ORIENTATION=+